MTSEHIVSTALVWIGALSVILAAPASLLLVSRLGKAFGAFQSAMQEEMKNVQARQDRHGDALHEVKQDITDINRALPAQGAADTPLTALLSAPADSAITEALARIIPLVTGHATQSTAVVADAIHKAQEISNTQELDRTKLADKTLLLNRSDLAASALPAEEGASAVDAAPSTSPAVEKADLGAQKTDAGTQADESMAVASAQADATGGNKVTAFLGNLLGGGKSDAAEGHAIAGTSADDDVAGPDLAPTDV